MSDPENPVLKDNPASSDELPPLTSEFKLQELLQRGVHQGTLDINLDAPSSAYGTYDVYTAVDPSRTHSSNPMRTATDTSGDQALEGLAPPAYEPPNRELARSYFQDHRPRRIKDSKQPTGHRRAKQRERYGDDGEPSVPYDFLKTGDDALDEFGAGVSLYFKSLKVLAAIFLVCAAISLLAVYENKKHQFRKENSLEQVDIPVYDNSTRQDVETPLRMLGSVYGVIRSDLKFYKQGMSDIVVTIILVIVALTGYQFERVAVRRIDEQQLTTKDYSVVVRNPPEHITDPDVYHRHFSQFGEVVFVTIVKNNGELVRKIGMLKDTQRMLSAHTSFQTSPNAVPRMLQHINRFMEHFGLRPGTEKLEEQIEDLKKEITELTGKKYKPFKVYVVFNSEVSRKNCIYNTAVSERTVWRNSIGKNASSVLAGFVLKIKNVQEPGDIIYEYSDVSRPKLYSALGASYALTTALLAISYAIIEFLSIHTGDVPVAMAVSLMNAALPQAVQFITFLCEIHYSGLDIQKSVLFKLLVARCVNSAMLLYMVTPYRETFSLESLERVQNILLADAITTPIFRLMNPVDIGMRYVVAPLMSTTQAEYNKFWMGAKWNLAERYSDVLKSVFVGAFFAPVMPSGLFMTTFAILLTYVVDKYSLYHLWRKVPTMGPDLAYLARYFYFATVFCHLHIALVYFANWPYRGVFESDLAPQADCRFLQCIVSDDMTDDQSKIVRVYSLSTIIAFAVLCFWGLPYRLSKVLKRIFYPYQKDRTGDASDIPFRSLDGVNAYIPLVQRGAYLTPYIVAQIGNVPKRYIPLHSGLKWDELPDPKEFSVLNHTDFVHIPDEQLKRAISSVTYYGVDDDLSADQDKPTEGLMNNQPFVGPPVVDDGVEMLPPLTERPMLGRQKSTRVDCDRSEDDDLPTGWEKRRYPDGGIFYMDNNTNKTHDFPPGPEASAPRFLEGKSASIFLSTRDMGNDHMLNDRDSIVRISVANNLYRATTGGSGYEDDTISPIKGGIAVLPPGWEEKFTTDGVPYFVDHNTKTSQWELPEEIKSSIIKTAGLKRRSL